MNDQRNAPLTPISKASTKEEMNCDNTALVDISPVVINPRILNGIARVNTSVWADSIIRVVEVLD